jgi:hypothetical protein
MYSCRRVTFMLKSPFSPYSTYKKDTSIGTSIPKIRAKFFSKRIVPFYYKIPRLNSENNKTSNKNFIKKIKAKIFLNNIKEYI